MLISELSVMTQWRSSVLASQQEAQSTREQAVDTIMAFLLCDFSKLKANILTSVMFEASESTSELYNCLKIDDSKTYKYLDCFLSMWNSCKRHNFTFVKTIRFQVQWISEYMEQNPNLKILFLIRDFRAILYSQARVFKTFNVTQEDVAIKAKEVCLTAASQLKELLHLKLLYPDRIKGIRYEDGCTDPVGYAKDIYMFAGLEFGNDTLQYITQITKSTNQEVITSEYGVEREDPTITMNNWRAKASLSTVQEIDRQCSSLYKAFGYKEVKTKAELKSDTRDLISKPKAGGIFN